MTLRLQAVLSEADFSLAEMGALVLDGEVYWVDGCVSPIDQVPSAENRALSLRAHVSDRLIAEQHSAAWIWGAIDQPPLRHEVCTDITVRTRPVTVSRITVREVVISSHEIITFGGIRLTTPMRTAIDLARFSLDFESDLDTVAQLMNLGRFSTQVCEESMNLRRNLPNKVMALARLQRAERRAGAL
ncbi:MAG TPA: type IV toxin-antitoxin system AbiEi family antitoxin, partial [Glaciihabitans sp.]|nr:type IV toxin-antitoxin system AbiEi family antitoxin [Glaciihabitans sp.]